MTTQTWWGYRISTGDGIVLACIAYSEQLGTIVSALMVEYPTVYVDTLDYLGEGRPASWLVKDDSDLGVPIWKRLDDDDANRRTQALQIVATMASDVVSALTEVQKAPVS